MSTNGHAYSCDGCFFLRFARLRAAMSSDRSAGRTRMELLMRTCRKVSVLAELVDGPRPDGELLGDLGHSKEPIAAAPEHPQVRQRGRHAGDWRPLLPAAGPFGRRALPRPTVRERGAGVG